MVIIPGAAGMFGVLPGHVPTISELKPGLLEVTVAANDVQKFFISSGFAFAHPVRAFPLPPPPRQTDSIRGRVAACWPWAKMRRTSATSDQSGASKACPVAWMACAGLVWTRRDGMAPARFQQGEAGGAGVGGGGGGAVCRCFICNMAFLHDSEMKLPESGFV